MLVYRMWMYGMLDLGIYLIQSYRNQGCYLIMLSCSASKMCPTRILEFVRLEKDRCSHKFFVRILNLNIIFFVFLLSKSNLDPNLTLSELSDLEKSTRHHILVWILTLSNLSDPNSTRIRIFAALLKTNLQGCY